MVGHFERVSETEKDNPTTMKLEIRKNSLVIHLLVSASILLPLSLTAQQINRTVLTVPEPQAPTITELDASNAKAPPGFDVEAPNGARKVVGESHDEIGLGRASTLRGTS